MRIVTLLIFFVAITFQFQAHAQSTSGPRDLLRCSAKIQLPVQAYTQVLGQISTTVLMEYAWPCAKGVLQGAWDATGGLLVSAGKCFWSPIQCARKARTAMKNAYSFFTHITEKVTQAMSALSRLPASAMAEIICSIIGGVGADVLVAILTAGAATGKLGVTMARISLKLERLASLAKKIVKLPLRVLARLKKGEMDRVERLVALGYEEALYASLGSCQ